MRASRLLQILLLLQNRGRLTSAQLAEELEVTPRTILRDVDAMTEAGLPIIVFQGNQGGIELGFNYRTRLTGLDREEAEALGVVLGAELPALQALGLDAAFRRARAKLVESFPDGSREVAQRAMGQFRLSGAEMAEDVRIAAFAGAVRGRNKVRIRATEVASEVIHPVVLALGPEGWEVRDEKNGRQIAVAACGAINISAHRF